MNISIAVAVVIMNIQVRSSVSAFFRHASVSRTYPCKSIGWLVSQSVTLSDFQSLVATIAKEVTTIDTIAKEVVTIVKEVDTITMEVTTITFTFITG